MPKAGLVPQLMLCGMQIKPIQAAVNPLLQNLQILEHYNCSYHAPRFPTHIAIQKVKGNVHLHHKCCLSYAVTTDRARIAYSPGHSQAHSYALLLVDIQSYVVLVCHIMVSNCIIHVNDTKLYIGFLIKQNKKCH